MYVYEGLETVECYTLRKYKRSSETSVFIVNIFTAFHPGLHKSFFTL